MNLSLERNRPISGPYVALSNRQWPQWGQASFNATPSCTGGPCPSGTAYIWSMNHALGTFNATTGTVVKFTAGGSAGTTYLFVNATLNGVTVQSTAVPVTITSSGSPHYTVAFAVHPTSCPIAFNGTPQTSGSTGSYRAGTYSIQANPCTNFVFQQWNVSGGVTVQRPTSSGGFANITGNGALNAYYVWSGRPLGTGNVTFVISPASCGPVVFGGINENGGSTMQFTMGNYSADAQTCTGYAFYKWTATGSLTLPGLGSNPTNVVVSGNGTLTASYTWLPPPPRYTVSFLISPSACSPVSFNGTNQATGSAATFLGGRYPAHALSCAGETFSQMTFQMPAGGSQTLSSPWGNVSVSTNGSLWVNYTASSTPLSVGLTPVTSSITAGQSVILAPAVTGGTLPYTCVWAENGTNTSQLGCTAALIAFVHPGNYTYRVWATDASGDIVLSPMAMVQVAPGGSGGPPSILVTLSANTTILHAGGSVTLALSWSQGDCPCHLSSWSWNGTNDTALGPSTSLALTLPHAGNYTFRGWVAENSGKYCPSATVVVEVLPVWTSSGGGGPPPSSGLSIPGLGLTSSLLLMAGLLAAIIAVPTVFHFRRRRARHDTPVPPIQPGPPPGFSPER